MLLCLFLNDNYMVSSLLKTSISTIEKMCMVVEPLYEKLTWKVHR